MSGRTPFERLPAAVQAEVQRILDAEARRLLAEEDEKRRHASAGRDHKVAA